MRSAAIRMVVSGVRSSWETSETNRCWTRDRPSSWRIWVCRLSAISLNDLRQPGEVVLAAGAHPLVEPAGGEPLGDHGRAADRVDDLPGDDLGDRPDQEDQGEAADGEGAGDEVEGGLLALHREHEVQVVAARRGAARPASRR